MNSGVLGGLIGGAVTVLIFRSLPRWISGTAPVLGGRYVMSYPKAIRWLSWVLLVPAAGYVIYYAIAKGGGWDTKGILFVAGLWTVVCMPLLLEVNVVRVEFDESSIYTFSPWRKKREIPWNDVVKHWFSETNQWHVFETRNRGKIRLGVFLQGIETFREHARQHGIEF